MIDGIQIVVSLATVPDRISQVGTVLECLRHQSLPADVVHLWLCRHYKRLNRMFSPNEVPASIRSNDSVELEFVEDWGPVTKLYPAVKRYGATQTIIVVVDDDREIPPDFLETLVRSTIAMKATCGYRGRQLKRPDCVYRESVLYSDMPEDGQSATSTSVPVSVDILTGTGGVAFGPQTLDDRFLSFWQSSTPKFETLQMLCDDIWVSGYMAANKIARFAIPCPSTMKAINRSQEDSLWRINKGKPYNDLSVKVFSKFWGQ